MCRWLEWCFLCEPCFSATPSVSDFWDLVGKWEYVQYFDAMYDQCDRVQPQGASTQAATGLYEALNTDKTQSLRQWPHWQLNYVAKHTHSHLYLLTCAADTHRHCACVLSQHDVNSEEEIERSLVTHCVCLRISYVDSNSNFKTLKCKRGTPHQKLIQRQWWRKTQQKTKHEKKKPYEVNVCLKTTLMIINNY